MQEPSNSSLSWGQVGLAILPGVFALGIELDLVQRWLHIRPESVAMFAQSALLFFCTLFCLLGFVRERWFPVWSFPALGIGLAYVSMGAVASIPSLIVWIGIVVTIIGQWRKWQLPVIQWEGWLLVLLIVGSVLAPLSIFRDSGPPTRSQQILSTLTTPLAVLAMLSVLPAIIGLLLTRRTGVLAALVFIGSAFVMWEGIGDPEYAMLMWSDNLFLERVVAIHPQVFFLIVVPLLTMRLRTVKTRIIGFLLPIAIALVSASVLGSIFHPYRTFIQPLAMSMLFILLPLAMVVVLYAWRMLKNERADAR